MTTRYAIPGVILVLLLSSFGLAQEPAGTPHHRGPGNSATLPAPSSTDEGRRLNWRMNGRLWKNAEVVKQLGLSDAQVQHMEQIFQDYRLKLLELHAALRIEEDRMGPILRAESPNENEVLEQIDKIAVQRANLEKTNAQMAFEIRQVLNPEQWKTLQSMLIKKGHHPGERHGIGNRPAAPAPQQ